MGELFNDIKMVLLILLAGAVIGAFIGLVAGVGTIVIQVLAGI